MEVAHHGIWKSKVVHGVNEGWWKKRTWKFGGLSQNFRLIVDDFGQLIRTLAVEWGIYCDSWFDKNQIESSAYLIYSHLHD